MKFQSRLDLGFSLYFYTLINHSRRGGLAPQVAELSATPCSVTPQLMAPLIGPRNWRAAREVVSDNGTKPRLRVIWSRSRSTWKVFWARAAQTAARPKQPSKKKKKKKVNIT